MVEVAEILTSITDVVMEDVSNSVPAQSSSVSTSAVDRPKVKRVRISENQHKLLWNGFKEYYSKNPGAVRVPKATLNKLASISKLSRHKVASWRKRNKRKSLSEE